MIENDPRDKRGLRDHNEDLGPYSESSWKSLEGIEQGMMSLDSYFNRIPLCGRINVVAL